jgi:UDP-glucose-4-epimerase GalE
MPPRPRILVAGGAGYIGSHTTSVLDREGFEPVVLDDLSRGHREAAGSWSFHRADLRDRERTLAVLREARPEAVMHFAAYCYVGESVTDPGAYYENNVAATVQLLRAMREAGVSRFIFSSSCAVFGNPVEIPMGEDHPKAPINPYGASKWMVERVLEDFEKAHGLRHVNLRYFNAAGADPSGSRGEDHDPETHAIPLILRAAREGASAPFVVHGDDYETPDGTCVRDYIHIDDLARAHVLALRSLLEGGPSESYNLGNGVGYSVLELIETARRVTGRAIPHRRGPRRPGDPPRLVGRSEKIRAALGWSPAIPDLADIVRSAWKWHSGRPRGYAAR